MSERTADPATVTQLRDDDDVRDESLDRKCWNTLREAASYGRLQPEGFQLVDELHDLHPDWRAQW